LPLYHTLLVRYKLQLSTQSAKPSYLSYLDYLGEFYEHDARI
jgi:hypothetical protein